MEKIRKIDVGTLLVNESNSTFEDSIRKRSCMIFENGGHIDDSSHMYELNGKPCYDVSKEDMDALKDRNTALEKMNCTPVWDENQNLKDRVKGLEDQLADQKKKYYKKLCEAYVGMTETFYESADKIMSIDKMVTELKEERDAWKRRFDKADKMVEDLKKENQKLTDRNSELDKELDRIRNLSIDSISKALLPFGVHVGLVNPKGPGTFELDVDIPELNEAKAKVAALEKKLRTEDSMVTYWRERKEEEEEYHHFWLHTYNLAVAHATNKGVNIFMTGEDAENNVGVILVKNEKVEELEAKWSAMLQALKEKGVEVLYMGEEDGKPNIDVNIPAVGDLKKELEDLKSKTVAEVRYEWHSDCFTVIYTKCDGTKEVVGMDLADDTDEKCTMGAFVCRVFNIPQCKKCKNHRYYGKISGHLCHLPDSKCIIPNTFDIFPLTDEEAEGPACDKFEAKE